MFLTLALRARSVLYLAPRCASELPELAALRAQLAAKAGREAAAAAAGSESAAASAGANPRLLALMAVAPPPAELKLQRLRDIAQDAGLGWDEDAAKGSLLVGPGGPGAPDLADGGATRAVWAAHADGCARARLGSRRSARLLLLISESPLLSSRFPLLIYHA